MMKALLWKECRENLYKLLMALGVCLVILVLRQDADFNRDFSQNIGEWVAFFGLFCAAVFGVDVVASERGRGTLGFLLAQPVTMLRILASKLVVGIGGLAISMAAIWAVVYAMPITESDWISSNQYIIEDVDYWRMVLIWLVPMALAYGMVFLASTVTDNPAKALAGGIGIFVAVMFGAMMVDRVLPELQVKFLVELLLRDVDFDDDGNILRSARDAGLVGRLLFAGVLTGTGFAAAVAITARLRENSVGWRPLLGCGVVLLAVFWGIGNVPVDRKAAVEPALELRFEQLAKDMVIDGARAYVLGEDDLIIVDISSTDSLRVMGRLPLDGLHRSRMVQCGQYICVGGYRNVTARDLENDARRGGIEESKPSSPFKYEVLVVDAGLTERPRVVDRHDLGIPEHGMIPFDMHFAKGALFVRTAGSKEHRVTAMAIDENGVVDDLSAVSLAEQDRDFWSLERSRSRQIASNALGTVLFLDLPSGLAIVDIGSPSIMEEIGRVQLEKKIEERVYGGSREILAIGDSILVFRLWPNEYAVLDVTDQSIHANWSRWVRDRYIETHRLPGIDCIVAGAHMSRFLTDSIRTSSSTRIGRSISTYLASSSVTESCTCLDVQTRANQEHPTIIATAYRPFEWRSSINIDSQRWTGFTYLRTVDEPRSKAVRNRLPAVVVMDEQPQL